MNQRYREPELERRWLICEQHQRWSTALRRFVPELMPPPLVASFHSIDAAEAKLPVPADCEAVVLWEVGPETFRSLWTQIVRAANDRPRLLQLVATAALQPHHELALSELPIALIVRQPEQLSLLGPLIRGHFNLRPLAGGALRR